MTKWGSSVGALGKQTKIDFKAVRRSRPVGQSCLSQLSSPSIAPLSLLEALLFPTFGKATS